VVRLRPFLSIGLSAAFVSCSAAGSSSVVESGRFLAAGSSTVALTTADRIAGGPCSVSSDGFIWYALPDGTIPPIDFTRADCSGAATTAADVVPPLPSWSRPAAPTQAIFVATSLQDTYSLAGMQGIERDAEGAGLPITWLVGDLKFLEENAAYYNTLHDGNGDDVELENQTLLYTNASRRLPWYTPSVSVEGAGHERQVAAAIAKGNAAFWGIAWNSHGTDHTYDVGAPWGTYCADVTSYKRPSPAGDCSLLGFEWGARDLTRAYLTRTDTAAYSAEAAYSSLPEDVLTRGGFGVSGGADYVRHLVDAYAAAGVSQPLVMVSEFESADEGAHGSRDDDVLTALYGEAKNTGMKAMTLRAAAVAARAFSARPRAIAFPFIFGGTDTIYNGIPFAPATIDYHDGTAGMTFISGHTMPSRVFEYALDPVSVFDRPLTELTPAGGAYPQLTAVAASDGLLTFAFDAPAAMRFGVAVWTDPAPLGLSGPAVTPAGHAGFVAAFDLPAGRSQQTVPCAACRATTFPFSI
jgi:hypothetical protein